MPPRKRKAPEAGGDAAKAKSPKKSKKEQLEAAKAWHDKRAAQKSAAASAGTAKKAAAKSPAASPKRAAAKKAPAASPKRAAAPKRTAAKKPAAVATGSGKAAPLSPLFDDEKSPASTGGSGGNAFLKSLRKGNTAAPKGKKGAASPKSASAKASPAPAAQNGVAVNDEAAKTERPRGFWMIWILLLLAMSVVSLAFVGHQQSTNGQSLGAQDADIAKLEAELAESREGEEALRSGIEALEEAHGSDKRYKIETLEEYEERLEDKDIEERIRELEEEMNMASDDLKEKVEHFDEAVQVKFINQIEMAVDVFWVPEGGQESDHVRVGGMEGAGDTSVQTTYHGHQFLFQGADGRKLNWHVVDRSQGVDQSYEIDDRSDEL